MKYFRLTRSYSIKGVHNIQSKVLIFSKNILTTSILYCFHDKIRIYFMFFIVQISPFVHLFTLKIVFRWPGPAGSLKRSSDPSPQVVPTFHFIPSYAPELYMNPSQLAPLPTLPLLLAPLFNQLAPLFETTRPLSKQNISNSPLL